MSRRLSCLSIRQPWAILYAGKDVENRNWPTKLRGRIAIHASKQYDREGHDWLVSQGYHVPEDLPTGAIVGEVTITDCYHLDAVDCPPNVAAGYWASGDYCFALADAEPYDNPIPQRGALGFFAVEVPA